METRSRAEAARENFLAGYNCTQSVVLAFSDYFDLDEKALLRMCSPLGGGMGRLREVCGTVSGMFLVLGTVYGYDEPGNPKEKTELYRMVQTLAERFETQHGSIVCRELLGLAEKKQVPVPEERTTEYYRKRPCKELAYDAAALLEEFLS